MSGCVKTFKVKDGKDKSNKSIFFFFCIDDKKLSQKYKTICNKIDDLKNIEMNTLPVYDDRYIKTKVRTYANKVYTNFHCLNMPEGNTECEPFTVISIILVCEKKYYLQVYLDNCVYNCRQENNKLSWWQYF